MTTDEMMAFAKNVASGGEFTKKEAVAFCKALTAETSAPAEPPAAPTEAILAVETKSPFVRVTAQGAVHVQVAQFFTKREALTLGRAIVYAAEH